MMATDFGRNSFSIVEIATILFFHFVEESRHGIAVFVGSVADGLRLTAKRKYLFDG